MCARHGDKLSQTGNVLAEKLRAERALFRLEARFELLD